MFAVNAALAVFAAGALVTGASTRCRAQERPLANIAEPAPTDANGPQSLEGEHPVVSGAHRTGARVVFPKRYMGTADGERSGTLRESSRVAAPRIRLRLIEGARVLRTSTGGPGQIQVTVPDDQVVGHLVEAGDDALTIEVGKAGAALTVPTSSVLRAQLSQHRSRGQGAARGLGLGVLGGAAAGAMIGLASGDDQCTPQGGLFDCLMVFTAQEKATIGAIFLGGAGGAVGLVLGMAFPGSRWVPARDLERGGRVSVNVAPIRRGATAAVSVNF